MKNQPGSSRHRSREVALQALYAIDVLTVRGGSAASAQEIFEGVAANFEMPEGARMFAKELVCEVSRREAELDITIAARARNWRVSRMAAVDRNILRLASYELAHTETPPAVIINEAVELARRFGSDRSPAFVNGIIDAVARAARESAQ